MSAWLDPLRAALDAAPAPVHVLLPRRRRRAGPTTGCSPCSTSSPSAACRSTWPRSRGPDAGLAGELSARSEATGLVGMHQHGYAHANHEPEGRKCEFGPRRPPSAQLADIARRAAAAAASCSGPRCSRSSRRPGTAARRTRARAWSRSASPPCRATARAGRSACPGWRELPVHVDWFATPPAACGSAGRARRAARRARARGPRRSA